MWFVCDGGKTVFNSHECINTVRNVHIWATIHTCGYFITDFLWLYFIIEGRTSLDYQTYAHHIVAATTFYQTLYFMDFCVVFGVMLLFIEASTVFVSARWLLFTHGMSTSKWYAINSIVAFFTFLTCRIIFQFYIVIEYGFPLVIADYQKKNLTIYRAFVVTEMGIMVIMSVALNSYWFLLMCKMILRVIFRAAKAEKDSDPTENVELV